MRQTYAIYLEISLDTLLPGFWEGISDFEFCQGLDRQNFRPRLEIARIEVEAVTEKNRACARQVVERAASRLMLGQLRRILEAPLLDSAAAAKLASVHVALVADAPNPESTHGMEGANISVGCPLCDAAMVRRSGRDGKPFWGCSQYPRCKGTRKISK